ncbi:PPOX class F420-dependent oxidoreductase [Actinoplanes sp. TFC3]|uniref:PPOX class F420-dependent oxidoreductase n=1 Tax=Actinoplanes sp. TFC3 TaxID=1710355 RepID=UPI000836FBF1|nr:PPOX class F420-dependent oxidoreductase [Actinoplanes sp. TFC3]
MSDDDLWNAIEAADLCTLATIKKDGRPQLSDVNYTAAAAPRMLRVSTRSSLAKVANLRRDPRATIRVGPPNGGYVTAEVSATMSKPAADEHDETVEELIEMYRLIGKREHPNWADYRRAMVADGRLVLRLQVEKLYGWLV